MDSLANASALQSRWSRTANKLKKTLDRTRWLILSLSSIAALLAALASQMGAGREAQRLQLSIASAILLGVVSFLSARLLSGAQYHAWTRFRAASEALKSSIYQYAASAAPFDDPATAAQRLNEDREKIAKDIDDLIESIEPDKGAGSTPIKQYAMPLEYVEKRVKAQIDWYENTAEKHAVQAKWLRRAEFTLSLMAAVLTAAVGVGEKNLFGLGFDFVALTSVLTTVAGAIIAHNEASKYSFLIAGFRAAARRLRNEITALPPNLLVPSAEWSAFVERCESILATETLAWQEKVGKVSGNAS